LITAALRLSRESHDCCYDDLLLIETDPFPATVGRPMKQHNTVRLAFALVLTLGVGAGAHSVSAQTPAKSGAPSESAAAGFALAAGVDAKTLGYDQLGSNKSGRAIYALKKETSARAALQAALGDVGKILGATPIAGGGFVDKTSDHGAGANFNAVVRGNRLKGSVLVGVGSNGAAVSILYAVANAPAEDWSALLAELPASIKLTDTPFGNGAGTIGLLDHWTISGSDNTGTVVVSGPDDQRVIVNMTILVLGPNSQGATQQAQLAQMAARMGKPAPPPKPVSAYLSPDKAMAALTRFAGQNAAARGQPAEEFKTLLSYSPAPATEADAESGLVVYKTTLKKQSTPIDKRFMMMTVSRHLPATLQGGWGLSYSGLSGPDKTFDRDLPTMIAIWNSYKPNMKQIQANGQQNMLAIQKQFRTFMSNLKATEDATNRFVDQLNASQMAAERGSADMDEVIRGYRKVYDTQSGEEADVNLADSSSIVNALNERDPGRYVAIPLRDEVQPLIRR
jgi:hypothetical protein